MFYYDLSTVASRVAWSENNPLPTATTHQKDNKSTATGAGRSTFLCLIVNVSESHKTSKL